MLKLKHLDAALRHEEMLDRAAWRAKHCIQEAKRHCQNGGDVCLAGNHDGMCCPEDSCDIDDGARQTPNVAIKRAPGTL